MGNNDFKFRTFVEPRRSDTYFSSRTNMPHKCYFGGSNQCACGKHRDPAGATGVLALATARERLDVEL